ncbi:DNA gyrase inhibitor YacG [Rhodovulum sulfidophilum]|uniref:DNA gyrase inhibitor YacG n=1 Tax=Rhodovulum sulfidophilum TaxID=35806 RepID=UPI00192199EF|nr:DNA gyrase inhibitor YacG [Rhodovulum sulfidophilum]MBL3560982.1 DNA gyrase inhibitor YacG [Rhodovulum sulfidophilum]
MTCPVCKKPTDPAYRPFCSRRCADVDLGRWLTGGYALPGDPADPTEPDDEPPPSPSWRH